MLSIIKSISLLGLEGNLINVEVDVSNGIPCFEIVGLPDTSLKEASKRVKTAIKNSGFPALNKKIIINLSPAHIRKEGAIFDLPIAIGILVSTNNIQNKNIQHILNKTIFVGELSLNGNINKINGILPICIEAKKMGISQIVLPFENAKEASIVKGLNIVPLKNLNDAIAFLNNKIEFQNNLDLSCNIDFNQEFDIDFSEVKGQENVKRALEIVAARKS